MFFQIKGQQKFLAWEEHHGFSPYSFLEVIVYFLLKYMRACMCMFTTDCTPNIEIFYGVWKSWKLLKGLYHGKYQATIIIGRVIILARNKTWVENILHWQIFWFTSLTIYFSKKLMRKSKLRKARYIAELYSLGNRYNRHYSCLWENLTHGPATWLPQRERFP